MWTELRSAIEKNIKTFGLTDVIPVKLAEWTEIENKVFQTFCTLKTHTSRPTWIWEHLKKESFGIHIDNLPHRLVDKLIDEKTQLYLLLNESYREQNKLWIYEGMVRGIKTILTESAGIDEVIIVDKKFSWILCINHHNYIIVSGEFMIDRLKRLQNELTTK